MSKKQFLFVLLAWAVFFVLSMAHYWPVELPFQYLVWMKTLSNPDLYIGHPSFSEGYFDNAYLNFTKIIYFIKTSSGINVNYVVTAFAVFSLISGYLILWKIADLLGDKKNNYFYIFLILLLWVFDISVTGFWYCNVLSYKVMHYCIGYPVLLLSLYIFLKGRYLPAMCLWASLIYISQSSFLIGLTLPIAAFLFYAGRKKLKLFLNFLPPMLVALPYFYFYPGHHFEAPLKETWFKATLGSTFSLYGSLRDWSSLQIASTALVLAIILIVLFIVAFRNKKNEAGERLFMVALASVFLFYAYFFIHDIFEFPFTIYFQTAKVVWIMLIAFIAVWPAYLSEHACSKTILMTPLLLIFSVSIIFNRPPYDFQPGASQLVIYLVFIMFLLSYDLFKTKRNTLIDFVGYAALAGFIIYNREVNIPVALAVLTLLMFLIDDYLLLPRKNRDAILKGSFCALFFLFLFCVVYSPLTWKMAQGFKRQVKTPEMMAMADVARFLEGVEEEGAVLVPYDQNHLSIYYMNCSKPCVPVFGPDSTLVFSVRPGIFDEVKNLEQEFYGADFFDGLFPEELLKTKKIMEQKKKKAYIDLSTKKLMDLKEKYNVRFVIRHLGLRLVSNHKGFHYKVLHQNERYVVFQI